TAQSMPRHSSRPRRLRQAAPRSMPPSSLRQATSAEDLSATGSQEPSEVRPPSTSPFPSRTKDEAYRYFLPEGEGLSPLLRRQPSSKTSRPLPDRAPLS